MQAYCLTQFGRYAIILANQRSEKNDKAKTEKEHHYLSGADCGGYCCIFCAEYDIP
jgi:hypothetical protein